MLLYRAEKRRCAAAKADMAEAVAFGYGGCKSREGVTALEHLLRALRDE